MEAYIVACLHKKLLFCYTVNTSLKKKNLKLRFKAIYLACKYTIRISGNKHTILIHLKSVVRPICQVKCKCLHMFWILRVLYSGGGP